MNALRKLLYFIPLMGIPFVSCTDVEKIEVDHIGGYNTMDNEESEAYYESLRAWKSTSQNYGRPVSFGWFSNWSPEGPIRKGYLSSLPDSMDFISMWSGPFDLNEAKIADKNNFQQKKGGKLFVCYILHNIGTGITPASVSQKVQEENPDASSDELTALIKKATAEYWGFTSGVKGSEDHTAAIKRYAKALVDTIVATNYDGLDIDWEPNVGGDGDGTLKGAGGKYLHVLISEMGKYFGPKATERPNGKYYYLLIDGELDAAAKESGEYLDYFISQAYGNHDVTWRVTSTKSHFGEFYDYRKHIFCENFESYWNTGGGLLSQAAYNHPEGPKGGVGAFRLDNDYDNTPDYKFMRQAIQINQQAYQDWMNEHNKEQ